MNGMTVAVIGDPELAAQLGKKGTVSDVTYYNLKRGEVGITYIEPSRFPDKIQSMMVALGMADAVLLVVSQVDKALGEAIVAIDAMGVERGHIILQNFVDKSELAPLIKGTVLEKYDYVERDFNKLNDMFVNYPLPPLEGPVKVPIDAYFNVKGVGTVVLGCVRRGVAKQHDDLQIYPSEKKAFIRSIQVHDSDVAEAAFGNRVGFALKNVDVTDFDRGCVMAIPGSMLAADKAEIDFAAHRFWKGELKKDIQMHAVVGLQIRPAIIVDVSGGSLKGGQAGKISLKFDKAVAYDKGDRIVLIDLDSKGLRVAGWGKLA